MPACRSCSEIYSKTKTEERRVDGGTSTQSNENNSENRQKATRKKPNVNKTFMA